MRGRALLLPVLVAAFGALAPSCLSPTLPLPPPDIEGAAQGATPDTKGLWEINGQCYAGADVWARNPQIKGDPGVTIQCSPSGVYSLAVAGKLCDLIYVSQSLNGDESMRVDFVLEDYQNEAPVDGGACP